MTLPIMDYQAKRNFSKNCQLVFFFFFLIKFSRGKVELPSFSLLWWQWWFSCQVVSELLRPHDCSLPGASVHGIPQARVLEWVVISFSRGSSRPWD